jgi:hypothetical protein
VLEEEKEEQEFQYSPLRILIDDLCNFLFYQPYLKFIPLVDQKKEVCSTMWMLERGGLSCRCYTELSSDVQKSGGTRFIMRQECQPDIP